MHTEREPAFWSVPAPEMLLELQTGTEGLKSSESDERLKTYGANILKPRKRSDTLKILLSQFKSPITIILLFAVLLRFKPLLLSVILIIGAIMGLYILTAEIAKRIFYRKVKI